MQFPPFLSMPPLPRNHLQLAKYIHQKPLECSTIEVAPPKVWKIQLLRIILSAQKSVRGAHPRHVHPKQVCNTEELQDAHLAVPLSPITEGILLVNLDASDTVLHLPIHKAHIQYVMFIVESCYFCVFFSFGLHSEFY